MEEYCAKYGIILEKTNDGYICIYHKSKVVLNNDLVMKRHNRNDVSFSINNGTGIDLYTCLYMRNEFASRVFKHNTYIIIILKSTSIDNNVVLLIRAGISRYDRIIFDMNDISRMHAIMDLYPSIFNSTKLTMKFVD